VSGAILISDWVEKWRAAAQRGGVMRRAHRLAGALAAVAWLLAAAPARADETEGPRVAIVSATIGGERFDLEVARNPMAQFRGLGGRTSIDPHGGMLFVFPEAEPLAFVMRDCPIPIDVAFLDAQGRVINVHPMVPERPRASGESTTDYESRLHPYRSALPARFAVEVAGGRLAELGVHSGDKIDLDLKSLSPH